MSDSRKICRVCPALLIFSKGTVQNMNLHNLQNHLLRFLGTEITREQLEQAF